MEKLSAASFSRPSTLTNELFSSGVMTETQEVRLGSDQRKEPIVEALVSFWRWPALGGRSLTPGLRLDHLQLRPGGYFVVFSDLPPHGEAQCHHVVLLAVCREAALYVVQQSRLQTGALQRGSERQREFTRLMDKLQDVSPSNCSRPTTLCSAVSLTCTQVESSVISYYRPVSTLSCHRPYSESQSGLSMKVLSRPAHRSLRSLERKSVRTSLSFLQDF